MLLNSSYLPVFKPIKIEFAEISRASSWTHHTMHNDYNGEAAIAFKPSQRNETAEWTGWQMNE